MWSFGSWEDSVFLSTAPFQVLEKQRGGAAYLSRKSRPADTPVTVDWSLSSAKDFSYGCPAVLKNENDTWPLSHRLDTFLCLDKRQSLATCTPYLPVSIPPSFCYNKINTATQRGRGSWINQILSMMIFRSLRIF